MWHHIKVFLQSRIMYSIHPCVSCFISITLKTQVHKTGFSHPYISHAGFSNKSYLQSSSKHLIRCIPKGCNTRYLPTRKGHLRKRGNTFTIIYSIYVLSEVYWYHSADDSPNYNILTLPQSSGTVFATSIWDTNLRFSVLLNNNPRGGRNSED